MIYSIHTLELTLKLDKKKFQKQLSLAYKKSEKKNRIYGDKDIHYDKALSSHGIDIEYHGNTYERKIKFIVNPSRVLKGDDLKLWKPNTENISELIELLENNIDDYFDSEYELDNFKLSRVDFTVNVDVGSNDNVTAYIKVLRNIGKVKGFSPKYKKNDKRIDKNASFDLEGNSNGIELSIYDKMTEIKIKDEKRKLQKENSRQQDAKGILRIEVRLKKQKTIRLYTSEKYTSKQISELSKQSKHVFLDTFVKVVPYGDYYKIKKAEKLIEDNINRRKPREKMIQLLRLIPRKKSLYLAQKELNDRKIARIMNMFAEINVSPVTISKSIKATHLKSLYSYLAE